MAEVKRYDFSYQEVVELLLAGQGITEGLWQLGIEFGFAATNIANDQKLNELKPAAVVAVNGIALSKVDTPSNLTVDASTLKKKAKG